MKQLILSIAMLAGGLTVTADDPDSRYAANLLPSGTDAPDFVIGDTGQHLSDLKGRFVVLDFWASWCPDCRRDIEAVKALHARYGTKGVAFVGVSFDTDRQAWRTCIAQNAMRWLHHSELKKWKKDTEIDRQYRIDWIPTYYLIGPDGKVVLGTVQHEKLAARLTALEQSGVLSPAAATANNDKPDGIGKTCSQGCTQGGKTDAALQL